MKNLPTDPEQGNVTVMTDKHQESLVPPGIKFLAFSGKKQTGKDTSMGMAKDMLEKAGKRVQFAAFAELLKDKICIDVLGLERAAIYGSNEDKEKLTHILWDNLPPNIRTRYSNEFEYCGGHQFKKPRIGPMSNREVMQVVGTDIFRDMIYPLVWAGSPFRRHFDADIVILTDLRFPNEKECTEEHGGIIIRLERNTGLVDNHKSEVALDEHNFKYVYQNNSSFDDLRNYINNILSENKLL
jgi:hypothetical protein